MGWVHDASPEVEHASRYPAIITVNVVFTLLMLIAVGLRLFTRKHARGLDDYIVLGTAVMSVIYNSFCIAETRYGLGLPIKLRPKSDVPTFKILSYAGKGWYQFGIAGFKLALCVSYLRFLHGINGRAHLVYRWVIISVATISTLFQAAATITNLFSCIPLAKIFDETVPGHCVPFLPFNYTVAAVTIATDLAVFLLPIQIFRRLQMDKRIKIEICSMFVLGLSTTICSTLRTLYLAQVETGNGDNTMVVVLGTVEFNVGLISCCLPFMRGIILRSWTRGRNTSTNPGSSGEFRLESYKSIQAEKNRFNSPKITRSDSQEEIIGHRGSKQPPTGQILRTMTYDVKMDDGISERSGF